MSSRELQSMISACVLQYLSNSSLEGEDVNDCITPTYSPFTEDEQNTRITPEYFKELVNYISKEYCHFMEKGYHIDSDKLLKTDFGGRTPVKNFINKSLVNVFGDKWETKYTPEFLNTYRDDDIDIKLFKQVKYALLFFREIVIYYEALSFLESEGVLPVEHKLQTDINKALSRFLYIINSSMNKKVLTDRDPLLGFYREMLIYYFRDVVEFSTEEDESKIIKFYPISKYNIYPTFHMKFYHHIAKVHEKCDDYYIKAILSDTMENIKLFYSTVYSPEEISRVSNATPRDTLFYYDAMRLTDFYCFNNSFLDYLVFWTVFKLDLCQLNLDEKCPNFGPQTQFDRARTFFPSD
jgi:hypothetical protein